MAVAEVQRGGVHGRAARGQRAPQSTTTAAIPDLAARRDQDSRIMTATEKESPADAPGLAAGY
jgi:hypothetical protein